MSASAAFILPSRINEIGDPGYTPGYTSPPRFPEPCLIGRFCPSGYRASLDARFGTNVKAAKKGVATSLAGHASWTVSDAQRLGPRGGLHVAHIHNRRPAPL